MIALFGCVYDLAVIDGTNWGVFPWWLVTAPLFFGGIYVYWQLETGSLSVLDQKIIYCCAYLFVIVFGGGALGIID
jgi:hypothetical protein